MNESNVLEMLETQKQYLAIQGKVETHDYYSTGLGLGRGNQDTPDTKFKETFTLKVVAVKGLALMLPPRVSASLNFVS